MGIAIVGCPGVLVPPGGDGEGGAVTGVIRGNVTDKLNGDPIEGANITTDPVTNDTKTDSDGGYVIVDVDPGAYTVIVSKDGYNSGTKNVNVKAGDDSEANIGLDPTVTSVEVTPSSSTIDVGETVEFSATVTYGNDFIDSDVNWSSSDESVAMVSASSDAVVTGIAKGNATIRATSNKDTSKSASAAVTIGSVIDVKSISVLPASVSIDVGEAIKLTVTVTYSDGSTDSNVIWSSSNGSVATVSPTGVATGIAPGNITITVISNRDASKTATSQVTVVGVSSVTITPPSSILEIGETVTLTGTVAYSDATTDSDVSWDSSNRAVATVSSSGVVTGIALGSTTITATSNRDNTKSASAIVILVGVEIVPKTATIGVGQNITLTATVTNNDASTDSDVSWSSSNPSVAIVSASGVVTGIATGSTTITSVSNKVNTRSASIVVTVVAVQSVSVAPGAATVVVGGSETFLATVSYSDGSTDSDVNWSSSNTSVATISDTGVATGIALGNATITATSKKDTSKSDSATFSVMDTLGAPSGNFDHDSTPPLPGALIFAPDNENECKVTILGGVNVNNCLG